MNVFDLIGQAARTENVLCVLIGGFALHFYGVDRQTMDVDFLVSSEDFAKLEGHLTGGGYRLGEKSNIFARFIPSEKPKLMVDFLFAETKTVERIKADGKIVDISGRQFVVPSAQHMVALKLHAIRQNPARKAMDLADITALIQHAPEALRRATIQTLCGTHGTPELFDEILSLCPSLR
jgi:hypothetical protein